MEQYDPKQIEKKWQEYWLQKGLFNFDSNSEKEKFYGLVEFPYPSGDGLHTGHVRGYTAMDIIARKRRAQGYNVLYPIGWDAFGLPTENYAIKTGKNPNEVTKTNSDNFRSQMKSLGFSFDWSREVNTTDPKYYKWTQWLFLQFLKHDLAYKAKAVINWCPKDKIGLANEEVVSGCCERCGTPVERREKEQWMLAITKYAERLDKDLDTVNYQEKIKLQQRNWIGRSEGAEIIFKLKASSGEAEKEITVFTTRPDTIFGATYVVLAPEHPFLKNKELGIENSEEVEKYIVDASKKEEFDRTDAGKEKTGVELKGVRAVNPATKEEIPVFVADYVLGGYGTGAVMAVPAHDERDFAFAQKYNLPVRQVVMHHHFDEKNPPRDGKKDTTRNVVHVILRDTTNKKVLIQVLKGEEWGNEKPQQFIIGGIEDGESEIETAIREVREETGYTNIQFIQKIPFESSATFFAAHKDVNRVVHVHPYVFDLVTDDRVAITEDEHFTKESHELKWVPYSEVKNYLTILGNKFQWQYLQTGGFAFSESGVLTNSGPFNGINSEKAKKEITDFVGGKWVTKFKLRDWVFSRQRYWGEPIPVIHCQKCGIVAVPEKDLPVLLPEVDHYVPTENGESPLATIDSWVNTACPSCGGDAKRETDVMPNWAGSSWYFLRYCDPKNDTEFANMTELKKLMPVDWYNGGMEHTTLHLLYSRFWNKFLFDIGLVPTSESYQKRTSHGLILAEGGVKMSKSLGNVVNPDEIVRLYGADTLRVYEMFMGPFAEPVAWSTDSIIGPRRFLDRVWKLGNKIANVGSDTGDAEVESLLQKTITKVSEDIESMSFNTAVSSLMVLQNAFEKAGGVSVKQYSLFVQLLAPLAPHIAEELWALLGGDGSVMLAQWPIADTSKISTQKTVYIVQVNGKTRAALDSDGNEEENTIVSKAQTMPELEKWIGEMEVKKVIFVKNRLVNFVV